MTSTPVTWFGWPPRWLPLSDFELRRKASDEERDRDLPERRIARQTLAEAHALVPPLRGCALCDYSSPSAEVLMCVLPKTVLKKVAAFELNAARIGKSYATMRRDVLGLVEREIAPQVAKRIGDEIAERAHRCGRQVLCRHDAFAQKLVQLLRKTVPLGLAAEGEIQRQCSSRA